MLQRGIQMSYLVCSIFHTCLAIFLLVLQGWSPLLPQELKLQIVEDSFDIIIRQFYCLWTQKSWETISGITWWRWCFWTWWFRRFDIILCATNFVLLTQLTGLWKPIQVVNSLNDKNNIISWNFKHPALIPLNSRSGD